MWERKDLHLCFVFSKSLWRSKLDSWNLKLGKHVCPFLVPILPRWFLTGKVDPASTCVYISLIRIWEQILTCSRRSVGQLIQFLVSMHSKYYYRFGATGDCPDELWTWLILLFQHYSVKAHLKTVKIVIYLSHLLVAFQLKPVEIQT